MAYGAEQIFEEFEEEKHPCSNKPIDLVHLSRQTFGNKDLENEVLGLFYKHSQQCLTRLREATTPKQWAEAMHSIKGSSRGIGAWEIGELAEKYECTHPTETETEKEKAVRKIENLINTTNKFIKNLI